MGGGTSKFEVTDWQKADGLLQETKDTIDGSPPTKKYQVVHLIKKGINQREFDIIDDEQNLLYTTRAVPGTLAWFDVLGPKSCADYADFLLRVQVDLARRTWIVYRYHRPVFEGQLPATLNPRKSLVPSVCLYKTACITVAWSRYVAISARYGPPSLEYLLQLEKMEEDENDTPNDGSATNDASMTNAGRSKSDSSLVDTTSTNQQQIGQDDDDDDEDLVSAAQKVAARRRADTAPDNMPTDGATTTDAETPEPEKQSIPEQSTDEDGGDRAKNGEPEPPSEDAPPTDTPASQSMEETHETTTSSENATPDSIPQKAFSFDAKWPLRFKRNTSDKESSKPTDNNDTDDANTDDENLSNNTSGNSLARTSERFKQYWANRKLFGNDDSADAVKPPSRKEAAHQAAMEGVIDLDGPLVECQEIYNKFFGNHQTSYIAKDQVLKLLPLDEAQHRQEIDAKGADDSENPFVQAVHQQEHDENPEEQADSQSQQNWLSRLQQKMSTVGANSNNNDANEDNTETATSTAPEKPMGWKYFDRTLRGKSNATSPTTSEEATGTTNKTSPRKWFKFGARQGSDEHKPAEEEGGVEVELSSVDATGESQVSSVVVEDSPDKEAPETTADVTAVPTEGNEKEGDESAPTEPTTEPVVAPIADSEKNANSENAEGTASKNDATSTEEGEPKQDSASTEPTGDKVDTNPTEMLSTEAAEETLGAEPLICYWAWRNSYMVQKVELHLAQNSDLALHVVLAILCNQVRYERNALAMTV